MPPSQCLAWCCCWACWPARGTGPAAVPAAPTATSRRACSTSIFRARPPVPGLALLAAPPSPRPRPGLQARRAALWLQQPWAQCPRSSATCQPDFAAQNQLKQQEPCSAASSASQQRRRRSVRRASCVPIFIRFAFHSLRSLFSCPQLIVWRPPCKRCSLGRWVAQLASGALQGRPLADQVEWALERRGWISFFDLPIIRAALACLLLTSKPEAPSC